jgi:hypothetical protein
MSTGRLNSRNCYQMVKVARYPYFLFAQLDSHVRSIFEL